MIWNLILGALAAWFLAMGCVNATKGHLNLAAYCLVVMLVAIAILGVRLS